MEENTSLIQSLVVEVETPSISFSNVSRKNASDAMISLDVGPGGRLVLPDLEQYMPAAASLTPFEWGARESETDASKQLLPLLQSWVVTGARPPIPNLFLDVQGLAHDMPIELHVEHVAVFKGMPDAIVAARGIGREEEASPTTSAAVVAVDWKTPTTLSKYSDIVAIGHVLALAFARNSNFAVGKPVFFSDMHSGFRGWIILNSTLYYLHPDDRDLTLAEGVALIRYFLAAQSDGRVASVEAGSLVCVSRPPGAGAGVPRDVSPESDGSDHEDDLATLIMSIAAAREQGGGVPHLTFG